MRLAVEDAMAWLDHGEADRLSQVALARAGPPEEQPVLVLCDEAPRGELEDEPHARRLLDAPERPA